MRHVEHPRARSRNMVELPEFMMRISSSAALLAHIAILVPCFAILFPLGSAFGHVRHRFHIPVQIVATLLTLIGFTIMYLRSRGEHHHHHHHFSWHVKLAPWLLYGVLLQALFGIWRRLTTRVWRVETQFLNSGGLRTALLVSLPKFGHRWIGRIWVLLGCIQIFLGVIKLAKPCESLEESKANLCHSSLFYGRYLD